MRNHPSVIAQANEFFEQAIKPALAEIDREQLLRDLQASKGILALKEHQERQMIKALIDLSMDIALDRLEIRNAERRLEGHK